jgi:hypothetical protein
VLTTTEATKLGQNVATDVNANVALPPGPARHISPDAAILFNKAIVARPLMVPEVCSIQIKNLEYRYRWVNRDGQGGRIYMQRRAQGFINATTEDVGILGGDAQTKDGEIRAGDLILMKIRADIYDAAMKYNMQKADTMARTRGVQLEGASSDVYADDKPRRVSVSEEPFAKSGKATPFIPTNAEALINDSIQSGRVDKTRATMDEMRSKGASKVEV